MGDSPRTNRRGIFLTAAIWILGAGLQFAAPLLRDRVPLSDDLLVGSFVNPLWLFGQVLLLAGVLTLVRKAADGWATGRRTLFALALAILCSVPQPDLITQLVGRDVPLADNPLRVALLWSTPLAFYVTPAALVAYAWVTRRSGFTMSRALGAGLVVIGVLNFPYILWLTRLWRLYIEPSGGDSAAVLSAFPALGLAATKGVGRDEPGAQPRRALRQALGPDGLTGGSARFAQAHDE